MSIDCQWPELSGLLAVGGATGGKNILFVLFHFCYVKKLVDYPLIEIIFKLISMILF